MSAITIKQAVIRGPTAISFEDAAAPMLQSPGDVLIRPTVCGICSGDLMEWYLARKVGTVLGHEVVGRVLEVGPAVKRLRAGQRVFVHHHAPCLDCRYCRLGDHVHCKTWRETKLDPGGMAERVRVPAANAMNDSFAIDDIDAEAGVFIEPLGCSLRALRLIDPRRDEFGVVYGCGIMGLLNLMAARALGVRKLCAVEPDPFRRAFAARYADRSVHPNDLAEIVDRRDEAGFDFAIVGPGRSDVILNALRVVRNGGLVVLFAPTPTRCLTELDLGEIYFREIRLAPAYSCGPDETRKAYDLIRRGVVDPRPLVTHRFPLAEVQRAYDAAKRGGDAIKVLVDVSEDNP